MMASYVVNPVGVAKAEALIVARQYVPDSDWGEVQSSAEDENAFIDGHGWDDYSAWHLGLTEGATDEIRGRYAFAFGDFRSVHRMGRSPIISGPPVAP